jgi:hypothetical protein
MSDVATDLSRRSDRMTDGGIGSDQSGQVNVPDFQPSEHPVVMSLPRDAQTGKYESPVSASQSAPGTPSLLSLDGFVARMA